MAIITLGNYVKYGKQDQIMQLWQYHTRQLCLGNFGSITLGNYGKYGILNSYPFFLTVESQKWMFSNEPSDNLKWGNKFWSKWACEDKYVWVGGWVGGLLPLFTA